MGGEVERTDYAPKGTIMDDLRVLKAMWFGNIKGGSHQDQLESFYNKQVRVVWPWREWEERGVEFVEPDSLAGSTLPSIFPRFLPLSLTRQYCILFRFHAIVLPVALFDPRLTCMISIGTECFTAESL